MAPTPQYGAPRSGRRGPPLDTSGVATTNKRYSYSDTPVEMQASRYPLDLVSPTNSTIDESPITTPASLSSRVLPIYTEPETAHALQREEKAHLLEQEQEQRQHSPPPQGVHPAYYAPYSDGSDRRAHHQQPQNYQQKPQDQHQPQRQQQSPASLTNNISPQVSITAPTPLSPNPPSIPPPPPQTNQTHHQPKPASKRDTLQPHSPPKKSTPKQASSASPALSSTTTTAPTPTIIPDTFAPPPHANTSASLPSTHLPGQSLSPQTHHSPHWTHSLLTPTPTCCLTLLLPCVTYGKTQHRLNRKLAREDPTNLLGYSPCNGECWIFALACGFQGILAAVQRRGVRKVYGIEGDLGGDLLRGCCCSCCVLAADEREMRVREEGARGKSLESGKDGGYGGFVGGMGGGMAYAPPPRRER